jgi:hypothetical protein
VIGYLLVLFFGAGISIRVSSHGGDQSALLETMYDIFGTSEIVFGPIMGI